MVVATHPYIGFFYKIWSTHPSIRPTWRVGISHFQLWMRWHPPCAQTVPFFSALIYISQYGEAINPINPRDAYAPLIWITTDPGNGLVSSQRQAIAWSKFYLWLGINCSDFFSRWKKTGLETICKIVVILSRSQCVKHGIDLYRYRYVQSCIHQTDIRVIVWKTQEKATSRTLLSQLCKPVAYTETTCVPDPSITTLQQENLISYEMITKCCNDF